MEATNEGWLETVLKRDDRERSVVRVLRVAVAEAHGVGDSYGSELSRIKMDVVLGSGRKAKRSIILKKLPACEARAEHLKKFGLFEREIKVYRDVLPLMEDLMEEFEDRSQPMWGRCLHYHPYDSLTMEDLKEGGYCMGDRRLGLDLTHCTVAIKGLARFHALSAVLTERGLLAAVDYGENIFTTDPQLFQYFHNKGFATLAGVIEKYWGPEWQHCVGRLRNQMDKSAERLINTLLFKDPSLFTVLCHGDPWVTNMMFDYVPESNTPIHVKFLDFQLSSYNSFAHDLQYFLSTSLNMEVREKHTDDLLEAYHTTLRVLLNKYGYKGSNAPTLDVIKKELVRLDYFRFILICCNLSYMMTEPENVPDIDELVKDYYQKNKDHIDDRTYTGSEFTKAAKFLLQSCIENGTI